MMRRSRNGVFLFDGKSEMNYNGFKDLEEEIQMNYILIAVIIFFIILITMQYSLNKIIVLLKEIKDLLRTLHTKE